MKESTLLTPLELDGLTELINMGASRAAVSLRAMVGEQVILSVPTVTLVSRQEAIDLISGGDAGNLVGVHQVFEGDITGRAILIFPETKSLELVRAVTGGNLSLDEIIDLEHEALAETGNIILNGCLATIANLLQRRLRLSLPEILRGKPSVFFELPPPPHGGQIVMFFFIDFLVKSRDLRGYIAMLMDLPSLEALKHLLADFIERAAGKAPHPDEQL